MKKMYRVFARRDLLFGGRIWDCGTLIISEDIKGDLCALREHYDDANSDLGFAKLTAIPEAVWQKMTGRAEIDPADV